MTTPQTTTKRLAAVTGLALVAVIGVGSVVGSNSAAGDLTPTAYKALVKQGLGNVSVDFDGREAKLANGTPQELAKAEKIVEGIKGVRRANVSSERDSGTSVPTPPTVSLNRSADGINLSGVVPNAEVASRIKAAAASSFGAVTGGLKVDRKIGTADWLTTFPELIPSVADVNDLTLSVDGDSLAIGGSLDSQAKIDTLTGLVEPDLGDLRLDNALKVDAGVVSAEDALTLTTATVYFARGSSILDAKGKTGLDAVADVLKRSSGVELEIGGHAGPSDPARGKILSDERVASVKSYLVAAGVDAARLSTRSYGSDRDTNSDAFAEQFRRVDFTVKGS